MPRFDEASSKDKEQLGNNIEHIEDRGLRVKFLLQSLIQKFFIQTITDTYIPLLYIRNRSSDNDIWWIGNTELSNTGLGHFIYSGYFRW